MKIKHLKMKASVILTLFCALQLFALKTTAQKFDIDLKDQTVEKAIAYIKSHSDYKFFYQEDLLKEDWKISVKANSADIFEVLEQLFEKLPVSYIIKKKQIILKPETDTIPSNTTGFIEEQQSVSGKIRDHSGVPIMGATVWIKNTRKGVSTNENGYYSLSANTSDTLVYNFLGFKQEERIVGNQSVIDIVLQPDVNNLDEVTIMMSTGYQKIAKERATGSFSVIDGEELQKVPVNNIMNQLEGRVAGLQIDILESDNTFVYSNQLGDTEGNTSYNFRIRGQSTYQGNDAPLIVIDGAPTELDIKAINSDDVEKITFLKDAASASIYGARAANGVIVIDTKHGSKGKTRINYSQNYTFSSKPSLSSLPLMNSTQVLDLEQELIDRGIVADPALATSLYNSTPISRGMEIMFEQERGNISEAERENQLNILRERNNYNQITQYLLQPSSSKTYNLSLSGGKGDYTYFTSASYAKEETQTKGNDGKRLTLTANQNFKLFDYAEVSTSLKGSFFDFNQNGIGLNPLSGSLTTFLPYNEIVDENGEGVGYDRAFYSGDITRFEAAGYLPWGYNYLDELQNSDKTIHEQNYSANIQVVLPITKGLSASGTYFIERSYKDNPNIYNQDTYYTRDLINQATFLDPTTNVLSRAIPLGSIYQKNKYIEGSQTTRGQLNYNAIFGKHAIDAIAGMEFRETRNQISGGTLFGYNEKTQTSIDLPATNYTSVYGYNSTLTYNNTNTNRRRRFLSYYGNAAYTYNNKYVFSGSIRLDDYNNFGVDKSYRRTPLWSTGFKWNSSKESFLKDVEIINNLSFRATYGFNGNISLTTFPFTNISIADIDFNLSQLPYAFVSAAANPALRWEKTGVLNFGIDFSILNNRLNGSIEYYQKNSKDLIQNFPVSEFYGLPNNTLTRNTATLKGRGIDLNLNGDWLRLKDFKINTALILSYNKNEVTDSRYESYSSYLNGTGSTPPIKGYGLNSLFAFRSAGLDENGSVQVFNRDGEIVDSNTALTDIEDMVYVGTRTPKYYGSFNTTLNYKKISLYVLATYKLGYKLFKPSFTSYVTRYGTFSGYSLDKDVAERWREPGDEAGTNVPGVQGLSGYSYTRYLYGNDNVISGDHLRLREVSLSYDLSSVLANTFINGANLSFTARNLGLIWKANSDDIDPDFLPYTSGNQLRIPPTAMYSLGLNINF
ncbi:TonB-linked outer membrane protein, SusC/RagA family [Leeuwenhoekiella marinoflava DSM 3653]|uniref:TonB-linked SusC/RagA family outer membrane protein n=3 Tax=Leeuwenhoekiella marinoflava TaxID=988 RepID=A0A4Q0PNZ7_9FLAO|nr:TonB-linked SusC/RagA family outer membrane protein [Leeuwenhoekiella marinoflava]SHE79960.1 TonB-linked outer membrane protein, SusC/RagA family [Leeuwenhoekiella marinoflava DSM 3653]